MKDYRKLAMRLRKPRKSRLLSGWAVCDFEEDSMGADLNAAQADMRFAYLSGGPGILVSAAAWLTAAFFALHADSKQAVWVLFVGGALIHPVSVLLAKVLGRPGKHAPGNPLAALAAATTLWLIFSLPLCYAVSVLRIEWFFPAMLLVIGGRYLTFALMFGMRVYWIFGLALATAGFFLGRASATPALTAFVGAGIEAAFAVSILLSGRHEVQHSDSAKPKPLGGTA